MQDYAFNGRLARWIKWRACDVGEAKEGLESELWRRWSNGRVGEWAEFRVIAIGELILQHFRHFTYVIAHSPTLPLLHLRHSSLSNPSFDSPTSQTLHLIHLASRTWLSLFCDVAKSMNMAYNWRWLCHRSIIEYKTNGFSRSTHKRSLA